MLVFKQIAGYPVGGFEVTGECWSRRVVYLFGICSGEKDYVLSYAMNGGSELSLGYLHVADLNLADPEV